MATVMLDALTGKIDPVISEESEGKSHPACASTADRSSEKAVEGNSCGREPTGVVVIGVFQLITRRSDSKHLLDHAGPAQHLMCRLDLHSNWKGRLNSYGLSILR